MSTTRKMANEIIEELEAENARLRKLGMQELLGRNLQDEQYCAAVQLERKGRRRTELSEKSGTKNAVYVAAFLRQGFLDAEMRR